MGVHLAHLLRHHRPHRRRSVRFIDRLCSFFTPCMHAPLPPACLLRLVLTAATFSPSRHHHQTWRWRALSPYATAASRRQSRAACVTVLAPFTAFVCDKTKTPEQCSCSGKAPVFGGHTLGMSIALGNKKPSTLSMRRDFDGPRATTSMSNRFFVFFISETLQ